MEARGYGEWSKEEFQGFLRGEAPVVGPTPENLSHSVELLQQRGHHKSFVEAFREFLLDTSLTFEDRAALYLKDNSLEEDESRDYFKYLWEHLAPGEPWPLEEPSKPKSE